MDGEIRNKTLGHCDLWTFGPCRGHLGRPYRLSRGGYDRECQGYMSSPKGQGLPTDEPCSLDITLIQFAPLVHWASIGHIEHIEKQVGIHFEDGKKDRNLGTYPVYNGHYRS